MSIKAKLTKIMFWENLRSPKNKEIKNYTEEELEKYEYREKIFKNMLWISDSETMKAVELDNVKLSTIHAQKCI